MEHEAGLDHFQPAAILVGDTPPDAAHEVCLEVVEPVPGGWLARATIRNTGLAPIEIAGIRWRHNPRVAGGGSLRFAPALKPRVFATENLRGDYFFAGTVQGDSFAWPLANQTVEFGHSEDHVFPAIFIAAESGPVGLFIAQAGQRRFHAIFRFRGHLENRPSWLFEIEERISGIGSLTLAPGESLSGENLFFQFVATNDPQDACRDYYRVLHREGAFARRELNPLRSSRIYCSWNYDFLDDIDEEKLLGQIPLLKEHFPNVGFLQLDDGYQSIGPSGHRRMIDFLYEDPAKAFNPDRFPSGPKELARKIKAAGLRPAIWLGLWAGLDSPMLKENPDWILRDDTGEPLVFTEWYGGTAVLDPSVPGVASYLDRLCATVFGDWGFEGVKLDFSSFAFNGKRVRFRFPGKGGVELRHELEGIFRKYLPRDGFLGWCVVAGTAQPFLSQADYFRNALDIGYGNWETARRIALWTANTLLFLRERPCLPNIDSIGWNAAFDETSWLSWLNFCAVSGAALEVSGDLRKLPIWRLNRLARTLELSDPDRIVRSPDIAAPGGNPPAIWFAEGGPTSLVGVFNWFDDEREISLRILVPSAMADHARDAFTGEAIEIPQTIRLGPRESRLWEIAGPAGVSAHFYENT